MRSSLDLSPKKVPYQPPRLLVYGNLAQMTQSGGSHGMQDTTTGKGKSKRT